jgi:hypothetical protein
LSKMASMSMVFEETYRNYLGQVAKIDLKAIAQKLGVQIKGDELIVPLFNRTYSVSSSAVVDLSGEKPPLEACVVLCKYLLLCPETIPAEETWVCYRDLKDAGPLTVFFANNVEQAIADHFACGIDPLEKACRNLGGFSIKNKYPYDLCVRIVALPRVPLLMLYNDTDEEFPAKCSVLFERRSEKYLDCECLAILGALFVANLKGLL